MHNDIKATYCKLLVQSIIITWTKRQRTSQHARLRAEMQQTLPLPAHAPLPPGHVELAGDIYYHVVQYAAEMMYQTPHVAWKIAASQAHQSTKLAIEQLGLHMPDILYTPQAGGALLQFDWSATDRRRWLADRQEQRVLMLGQWLQLRLNERVLTWDEPYYVAYTLNIGWADACITDFFITHAPTYAIDDRHQLF